MNPIIVEGKIQIYSDGLYFHRPNGEDEQLADIIDDACLDGCRIRITIEELPDA